MEDPTYVLGVLDAGSWIKQNVPFIQLIMTLLIGWFVISMRGYMKKIDSHTSMLQGIVATLLLLVREHNKNHTSDIPEDQLLSTAWGGSERRKAEG